MNTSKLILWFFLFLGILYSIGSFFEIPILHALATFTVVPSLLLYYRAKTKSFFWPIVVALLCFYIRDILLMFSLQDYMIIVMVAFVIGMVILYLCAITGFRRAGIHLVELISFVIMFAFLTFLYYSMSGMVREVIPTYAVATYVYLFMLIFLLGLTFAKYLLKSHWASLWLMIASAALLVSEISLFFRLYIIEDISVNLFDPVFHILMLYSLVQYGLHRRKTGLLPYF